MGVAKAPVCNLFSREKPWFRRQMAEFTKWSMPIKIVDTGYLSAYILVRSS
jgi:hypothetical protein